MPPLGESMEQVGGNVLDYYEKWGKLRSYAQAAWHNFGIDVTKPDFGRPESIEMNNAFMKGLAQLYNAGNTMQQGRQDQVRYATAEAQGLGRYTTPEGEFTSARDFRATSDTPTLARVKAVGKTYYDPDAKKIADQELEEGVAMLEQDLEEAKKTGDTRLIERANDQLQQAQAVKAKYDKNQVLNRAQGAAGRAGTLKSTNRPTEIHNIEMGGPTGIDMLKSITDSNGVRQFPEVLYNNLTGKYHVMPNTKDASWATISTGTDTSEREWNEQLNRGKGGYVSEDQRLGYTNVQPVYPDTKQAQADFAKKQAAYNADLEHFTGFYNRLLTGDKDTKEIVDNLISSNRLMIPEGFTAQKSTGMWWWEQIVESRGLEGDAIEALDIDGNRAEVTFGYVEDDQRKSFSRLLNLADEKDQLALQELLIYNTPFINERMKFNPWGAQPSQPAADTAVSPEDREFSLEEFYKEKGI
jgi:hypothetical protein